MDIADISMAMSQVNTQNAVGTAVLGNALDMTKVFGDEVVKMIDKASLERSVNPAIGGNIDLYA